MNSLVRAVDAMEASDAVVVAGSSGGGGIGNNTDDVVSRLKRILGSDNRGKGVPRRAAVTPCGKIVEKLDVKAQNNVQEIRVLSEVCELVCRSTGLPVFPRSTADLVAMCLCTNACGAWHALYSDMRTGDIDWATAVAALFGTGAHKLTSCFLAASDSTHLLYIAHCIMSLMDHASPEHAESFGAALAARMPEDLVASLAAHCSTIRRDMRDLVLNNVASLLAKVVVPTPPVANAMAAVLQQNRIELITVFMYLPVEHFVEHRPDIVDLLMNRCIKVPASSRYPLLAVLSRLTSKVPSTVASPERQRLLAPIVQTTLEVFCKAKITSTMDTRTMYATAMLGGMIADPSLMTVELFNLVCQALFMCSGTMLQKT